VLFYSGRSGEAITQLEQTLALDSTYVQARMRLVGVLLAAGRLSEAREQAQRLLVAYDSVQALELAASLQGSAGHRDSARVLVRELIARAPHQYVSPASIALLLGQLGDFDSALTWLEKAFAEKSNAIAYLAVEPTWDPYRGDPRFKSLIARAGLE